MGKIYVTAFVLVFLFGNALAEEKPDNKEVWATYHMTDMLDPKNNQLELRTFHPDSNPKKGPEAGKLTTEAFGKRHARDVETHTLWTKEVHNAVMPTYLKQGHLPPPTILNPNKSGFGYVEERRVSDGKVIRSWPVFYRMDEVADEIYRITFKMFLPDGALLRIVKEYGAYQYHFPMREVYLLSKNGTLLRHIIYARRNRE